MAPGADDPPIDIARRALAEILELDVAEITADASLHTDLGLDSLALIETLVVIEETHAVVMPQPDELVEQGVVTVADLANAVARAQHQQWEGA